MPDLDSRNHVMPAQLLPDGDAALIPIAGRGWLERKQTGGRARYWYQRWRERQTNGHTIKRSMYLSPVKDK